MVGRLMFRINMRKKIQLLLSQTSLILATFLLFVNFLVVMYGVMMRYVAHGAPMWTDELARYTMIGTAFLAAGVVWHTGEHMRVSLAERFLPQGMSRWVVFYQWLIALLISGIGTWLSIRYTSSVFLFQAQGLGVSRTIPMSTMPIGFALLTFTILVRGPIPLRQATGEAS